MSLNGYKIILASGSPRRAELLKKLGLNFSIKVPEIRESVSKAVPPRKYVLQIAEKKARKIARKVKGGIILGADTIVVLKKQILGKPKNKKDAFRILKLLSGKKHKVYTGIYLINNYNNKSLSDFECTRVKFHHLQDDKIWEYINSLEPLDKAGAYGIQGMGNFLVDYLEGDLDNVIGLPIKKVKSMLQKLSS